MNGYCQTCGSDPAVCGHGHRQGSLLLESLGFADSRPPRRALRVAPPPPPAVPVATTVGTLNPTRSTTGLVAELWEAQPEQAPFPPPEIDSITQGHFGLLRWIVGVLIAVAIGSAAFLGASAWLAETGTVGLAQTDAALAALRAPLPTIGEAPAIIADPTSDVIALGAISGAVAALDAAADQAAVVTVAHPDPLADVGIVIPDPLAGRRAALGQLVPEVRTVADGLSRILAVRLALGQLTPLPDALPSGADRTTIDALTETLVGQVLEVRSLAESLPDGLAAEVSAHADGMELATIEYVTALTSHDPEAETLAAQLERIHSVVAPTIQFWLVSEAAVLETQADRLADAVASVR